MVFRSPDERTSAKRGNELKRGHEMYGLQMPCGSPDERISAVRVLFCEKGQLPKTGEHLDSEVRSNDSCRCSRAQTAEVWSLRQ